MSTLKIDLITEDPHQDEFVLHLVEEGPWDQAALAGRLRTIQNRLYDTVDLVIDGHLASRYPESKAQRIRIQVDCHDAPSEVHELVFRFQQHMITDPEYQQAIRTSGFVSELRIVSGGDHLQLAG